jgi:hypothetical protein
MQQNYQWNPDVSTPVVAAAAAPVVQLGFAAEDISNSLLQHPTARYPMRTHADVNRIIIHHSGIAPNVSVQRIAEFMVKNKGLPGITYHFCITDTGHIYQTQPLEIVSAHAGANSLDSAGVCLLGDFTAAPPPPAQLEAASTLLAQLAVHLGLTVDQIFGRSELEPTSSPGATWPAWKGPMLARTQQLLAASQPVVVSPPTMPPAVPVTPATPAVTPVASPVEEKPTEKPIEHYLLFWHRSPQDWAVWDFMGAEQYIAAFKPVIGFDIQQAKQAKYVTIVGGPGGVPGNAEKILQAAGCQVERISGASETETRQMLQQLAREGKRFKTLK